MVLAALHDLRQSNPSTLTAWILLSPVVFSVPHSHHLDQVIIISYGDDHNSLLTDLCPLHRSMLHMVAHTILKNKHDHATSQLELQRVGHGLCALHVLIPCSPQLPRLQLSLSPTTLQHPLATLDSHSMCLAPLTTGPLYVLFPLSLILSSSNGPVTWLMPIPCSSLNLNAILQRDLPRQLPSPTVHLIWAPPNSCILVVSCTQPSLRVYLISVPQAEHFWRIGTMCLLFIAVLQSSAPSRHIAEAP